MTQPMLAIFLFGRGKSVLLLFELFLTLTFILIVAAVISVIVAAVISKLNATEKQAAPTLPPNQGTGS
jgi:hypothetical protein